MIRERFTRLREAQEEGRIMLLGLGFVLVLGMLVVGAIDVTAVCLARLEVANAADAAALRAADSADESHLYTHDVSAGLPITAAGVQEAAVHSLAGQRLPANVSGWTVAATSVDGQTASVRVDADVVPPISGKVTEFLGTSVRVSVESRARSLVGN